MSENPEPLNDSSNRAPAPQRVSRSAKASLYIAIVAGILALLAGFGTRFGLWHFRVGFIIMLVVLVAAIVAFVLGVIGIIATRPGSSRRGFAQALAGLVISLIVLFPPVNLVINGFRLPPIHDISTDTENPPVFVAILPLRQNADNPSQYGGPEIAAQQHKAYPNVRAGMINIPPQQAFDRALAAARDMGWEIVDSNPSDGRIEATATTFWFGFKDDVVVRVTPAVSGSRIDVRSVSRVGTSDVGANAKRIEKYVKKLSES